MRKAPDKCYDCVFGRMKKFANKFIPENDRQRYIDEATEAVDASDPDDYEGGKMAAKYLIAKGHSRIASIMNRTECSGCMRYAGYQSALMEAGIKEEPGWAQWYEYETFQDFLENEELIGGCLSKVTAVFCFNDEMALGIIELLKKQGIRVPEDMSVMGYDDSYMCMFGEKKLTSIRQEPVEQGERAAMNLLQLIKNPNSGADTFFEPSLVERETVRTV